MNIHIIGICGKLNAGLAVGLKRQGHTVTGSDKGFYPPMSTVLENGNIPIMVGYKAEHIISPDLVAYGAAIGEDNPEVVRAKELNIPTITPTELLEKFVVKENSIVITGNYGKTTITGLLVKIFKKLELNPSYMIGGEVEGLEPVEITNSSWSILEGDEYPANKGGKSKFFYYHPKYLIVTSVSWDHTDVFPTKESYEENFLNLLKTVPMDGTIVLNSNDKSFVTESDFGKYLNNRYLESEILNNLNHVGTDRYRNIDDGQLYFYGEKISPQIFGPHNLDNISLALGIIENCFEPEYLKENASTIVEAINDYSGASRRLQIKYDTEKLAIIDDFAHNPEKFQASLNAIEDRYPGAEIIASILPNLGNITKISLPSYKGVFDRTNLKFLFIPKWTAKIAEDSETYASETLFQRFVQDDLRKNKELEIIVEKDDNIFLEKLFSKLNINPEKKKIVLFMGSEPFRGMIDILLGKVKDAS